MAEPDTPPTDPNSVRMLRWTIVIALASWAAVAIAFWSMKAQREDARELLQAQIAAELDKEFDSTEMRKARKAFAKELLRHPERLPREDRVLSFFETVGNYLGLHRIDDQTTYNAFSYYAERYWAAAKPGIAAFRTKEGDKGYYGAFEDLNNRMLRDDAEDQRRPLAAITPSKQEVNDFLKEEAALNP